ncbi:MAG: hypothetical protein DCF30_07975, partial [Hyphomicrobiales bacterium]
MDEPRPGVAPRKPEEGWPTTAVGFQRQQRKAKRFILIVALTVMVGPVALVGFGFLLAAIGSGSAWSLLGIPFMLLGALISSALPVLVVGIFVFAAWAIITRYYRKPTAASQPSAVPAGTSSAAHPLAAEIALLE